MDRNEWERVRAYQRDFERRERIFWRVAWVLGLGMILAVVALVVLAGCAYERWGQ